MEGTARGGYPAILLRAERQMIVDQEGQQLYDDSMEVQLRELLETIKKDGVQQAERAAQEIVDKAGAQAATIVSNAEQQATQLLEDSHAKIKRLENSSQELLKQAARDLLLLVEERLIALLKRSLLQEQQKLLTPTRFAAIIVGAVSQGLANEGKALQIEVAKEEQEQIVAYLRAKLTTEIIEQQIEIFSSPSLQRGFRLSIKNGMLTYDLSVEAIAETMGQLLHPTLRQLLSEGKPINSSQD